MIFLPVVLSALLLAAHFLREGNVPGIALALLTPLVLLTRKRWSRRVYQIYALLAALIWLGTLGEIISWRIWLGQSWTASAIILGAVAFFTLLSGALLETPAARRRFR